MNNGLKILNKLSKKYPKAEISLTFSNPLQLLISVMLSAQCTDERVNKVTPDLFRKYKTAKDFANSDIKELESYVRSTGFYRSKAKNIKNTCKIITEKYNNKVPKKMEELLELPGVARKTANIVLSNAYGIVEGIAVDTHVKRISYRIGLTKNTNPEKIEKDLMSDLPKKYWVYGAYIMIEHGRAFCKAPVPICSQCPVNNDCPKNGVLKQK